MDRHTDRAPGAGQDHLDHPDPPGYPDGAAVPDAPDRPDDPGPLDRPDPAALRGTRFEFGGRRPFRFPPPRVTYRGPQRPLPGLGTVALGKVVRVVPYGAFVDFLGFRGLVHISQLLPGYRVERVEDVVQTGDEVVVRVIAVDPERRHINLALVPGAAGVAQEPVQASSPPPPISPASPPSPPITLPSPPSPPSTLPPAPAPATQAAAAPAPPPAPPKAKPTRAPVPAKPAPKTAAAKAARPQPASHHASRAVHREMTDPAHPMARLLAAAGDWALQPERRAAERPAGEVERPGTAGAAPGPAPEAPTPPPGADDLRPIHVAEPEPEPESDSPATLEALAARFGASGAGGTTGAGQERQAKGARDRSREAREKQAAILARLRGGGAPPR